MSTDDVTTSRTSGVKCTLSEGEALVLDYTEGCRLILGILDSCVVYAGRSGTLSLTTSAALTSEAIIFYVSAFTKLSNNVGVASMCCVGISAFSGSFLLFCADVNVGATLLGCKYSMLGVGQRSLLALSHTTIYG